jgi:Txe/YoeB family toxin of Txe-Axe toxin-antitoxin module
MSLSQIKRDLSGVRERLTVQNSQAEYCLSSAKEELITKINLISERMRKEEAGIVNAEELKTSIMERLSKRIEDPYFKQ